MKQQFEVLNAVRSLTSEREKHRDAQAEKCFQAALAQLDVFLAAPHVHNLSKLETRVLDTLRYKTAQAKPYVLMAYVLLIYNHVHQAVRFQKLAESIEPELPEVVAMRALIDRVISGGTEAPLAPVSDPALLPPDLSEEGLYDQIETLIFEQVKSLLQSPPLPSPSLDTQAFLALTQRQAELETVYDTFMARLLPLETDWDISELKLRLRPIESRLKQFARQRSLFERLSTLEQRIKAESHALKTLYRDLNRAAPGLTDRDLEVYYDRCDGFADEIDELEQQGCDILPLLGIYQELTSALDQLQDALDDTNPS
jgi:hypothetical protein